MRLHLPQPQRVRPVRGREHLQAGLPETGVGSYHLPHFKLIFHFLLKKKFNVSHKVRLLTSSCLCSAKPPGTAWAGSACAAPTLTTPCRQSSTISRPTSRLSPLYCTHIMENILLRTYLLNKHAFARIINGKMC